jgi:diacylglycerol kinase (ATP)
MRVGVVVNPTAGKGRGASALPEITDALALAAHQQVNLSANNYADALANAKRAISSGKIDALLVAGGDGMAHLGVNACAESDVPLGLIPRGTGNDSARALGIPLGENSIQHVIDHLEKPRRVDAMNVRSSTGQFFSFGTVSAGFDALVNQRANGWSFPKGASRYPIAMLAELANFKPISYQVQVDGEKRSFKAMLCAVANASSYGGGMLIAPEAKVDDGLLDLFVVHEISRPELIRIFPKVYTGRHVSHPAVEFVRAKSFHIEAHQMPVFADGEATGHSPLSVTVRPGALVVAA